MLNVNAIEDDPRRIFSFRVREESPVREKSTATEKSPQIKRHLSAGPRWGFQLFLRFPLRFSTRASSTPAAASFHPPTFWMNVSFFLGGVRKMSAHIVIFARSSSGGGGSGGGGDRSFTTPEGVSLVVVRDVPHK